LTFEEAAEAAATLPMRISAAAIVENLNIARSPSRWSASHEANPVLFDDVAPGFGAKRRSFMPGR
jgi:hypothetical protein